MLGTYSDLNGKVVLVTGGSRGLGGHAARAFAAQGAKVCTVDRDEKSLAATVSDITDSGGVAVGVVADVTDALALRKARADVEAQLGPVDILACYAGGQGRSVSSLELTEQRWHEVLDSELTSAFLTIRNFLPGMVDRRRGAIITVSSAAGRQPSQANLAYGVANAGLIMLTRHLATEAGPHGVRVNCLAPSAIRTEKVKDYLPPEVEEKVIGLHPLRRLGTADDVTGAALFLASDPACWLSGLTIDVAGGRITN